jgi:hypothetical protein
MRSRLKNINAMPEKNRLQCIGQKCGVIFHVALLYAKSNCYYPSKDERNDNWSADLQVRGASCWEFQDKTDYS